MSKKVDEELLKQKEAWEGTALKKRLDQAPERSESFNTVSGAEIDRLYGPWDLPDYDYAHEARVPRPIPVHPRHTPDDVPRPPLDDAPVCRLLDRAGDQPALQVPALPGDDGAFGGLSHAHHHGYLLGQRAGRRRGRQVRGGHRLAGRYGRPLFRHTAGQGHHLHDHQRPGLHPPGDVYGRGREAGRCASTRSAAPSRTTSSRNISPRSPGYSRPGPPCGSSPTCLSYCTKHVPRWNTISISGYHIREAGSTAVQELAFTLADGIGYVQAGHRGRDRPGRLCAAAVVLL